MTLEIHLFEQVADATRSLISDTNGSLRLRAHRRGVKAWFGAGAPPREHYEAQVVPRRHVDGRDGVAIEVGFHAEHREPAQNERVIDRIVANEQQWRAALGTEPEVGVFFGADNWRRVSEAWIEPDLDDPELAFEMAARLVDYVNALQPVLVADIARS